MDDLLDSSRRGEEEAPGIYECALAELLAAGIAADVRPLLQEFMSMPAALAEAYQLLPPAVQEQLNGMLPAGDAARGDGLRNPALTEALREFTASLEETPTPAKLQARRNKTWAPAVGDRCEGRYKAGEDGASRRREWFPCEIVEIVSQGPHIQARFHLRYDDGDEENAVARQFVRPPLPCVEGGAGAGAAGAVGAAAA